jgi:hypothetical protein
MGKLGKDVRPAAVHGIHQFPEIAYRTGMVDLDEAFKGLVSRVNGKLTKDDEAASSFCPAPVVTQVTSMDPSIPAEMGPVGEETDSIRKNRFIDGKGGKKMVKHHSKDQSPRSGPSRDSNKLLLRELNSVRLGGIVTSASPVSLITISKIVSVPFGISMQLHVRLFAD